MRKNAKFEGEVTCAKHCAHYYFWCSNALKRHYGLHMTTENYSCAKKALHTSKQNNKNNKAKHVKICTCNF